MGAGVALAVVASLGACSADDGTPTLTWYINPDAGGQERIAASCTEAADGAYRIETTLPPDVMLTSVRPEVDGEYVSVAMVVLGRRIEAIDRFIEALEATGSFEELLARQEEATDDGMFRTVLRGRYLGVAAAAVGAQPAEPGP